LKNSKSGSRGLPLAQPKTIAVIGQDAKKPTPDCDLNMCNDGTMVIGCVSYMLQEMRPAQMTSRRWGSGSYSLDYVVPPIDAIKSYIGKTGVVTSSLSNDINAAISTAKGKDVAIVFTNAYVTSNLKRVRKLVDWMTV
jgi:beta-glucosidase